MERQQEPQYQINIREKKFRTTAALVSLVASFFITALKFYAYNLTGSQGVFSDAVESIVNIATAAMAIFVIYYSAKPVDDDHPYGHGKVEYFSAAFEGGLIAAAALVILYEASVAFLYGHELGNLDQGTYWLAGAAVLNALLGVGLLQVGRNYNSAALKGSGHHIMSDVWTSVAIISGLLVIHFTGWKKLDIWMAVAAGLYLAYTGYGLVRSSIAGLLDEEDLDTLKDLLIAFEKSVSPGIIQIHHAKVIRSGWFHHIDAHVVVPEFWSITEAHEQLNAFEKRVIESYPYKGEMNFHTDPCRRKYCDCCDYPDCPVRQAEYRQRMPVRLQDLRSPTEPAKA